VNEPTSPQRRISARHARGAQSDDALKACYQRVFKGSPADGDADMVLADIANASGFYLVSGPSVDATTRAFNDGKRAVMARILYFLNMPADAARRLEEAARMEALADMEAGLLSAEII
jgi:hypothetical protein